MSRRPIDWANTINGSVGWRNEEHHNPETGPRKEQFLSEKRHFQKSAVAMLEPQGRYE